MKRLLPLLLLLLAGCPINASYVVGGKGPGRLVMDADQGPNINTCPATFGGVRIDTSARLKANVWLTMPTDTIVAAPGNADGVSVQAMPDGAGWSANVPAQFHTYFVTHLSYHRTYLDWWWVVSEAWGSCAAGSTGWCYYLRIQPTGNGGFNAIESGRVRPSTGEWCATYWAVTALECVLPPQYADRPDLCWLPQNSTQPYPEG